MLDALNVLERQEIGLYLGVPVCKGRPKVHHFSKLQAGLCSKLSGWKIRHLNMAGRACLINSSAYPMMYHLLQHCHVPQGLLDWVERQIRAFFWEHDVSVRRMHLIG